MCTGAETLVAMGMAAETAATVATVIEAASVAATIGGGVMSVMSARNQAQAAQDQANYQAAVQRNNAIIQERNAQEQIRQGELDARQQRALGERFAAEQTALMAAQGADVTEGSNVDLLADSAEASKLEEGIIRNNAERRAYQFRVAGNNANAQAGLYQTQADSQNPTGAAIGSGFNAFSNFASRWYRSTGGRP